MTAGRKTMEERRMLGCGQLREGASQAHVARMCGVSRTTASRWAAAVAKGADLTARKPPGRPARLTAEQLRGLYALWESRGRWTAAAFGQAIRQTTGVTYDPDHVSRLIIRLGLRPKRGRKTEKAELGCQEDRETMLALMAEASEMAHV